VTLCWRCGEETGRPAGHAKVEECVDLLSRTVSRLRSSVALAPRTPANGLRLEAALRTIALLAERGADPHLLRGPFGHVRQLTEQVARIRRPPRAELRGRRYSIP
jgi:hypothetical protein